MVSCAVKTCKNNSRKIKKSEGITFHLFPTDIERKNKWIAIIRKSRNEPRWEPNKSSVVCSDHFDINDLYLTNQGLRRVIRSGYPKKGLSDSHNVAVNVTLLPSGSSELPPICNVIVDDTVSLSASALDLPDLPNLAVADTELPCASFASTTDLLESPDLPAVDTVLPSTSATSVLVLPVSHDLPKMTDEIESIFDTPRKFKLRQKLKKQNNILQKNQNKIKKLQQSVRRLRNKNKSLKDILSTLNNQYSISSELYDSLNGNIAIVDIFNNLNRKKIKKNIKYTPAVKKFCLTLNYHSPKAYEYVRNTFNTCLPHPKTLSRWYGSIKGEPGFTDEAFQALKAKSQVSDHRPVCSLVFDEVAIRAQKIWDGKKYIGFVDMGTGVEESAPLATQALVFLLVGINHRFKIPLGYFLINSASGEQKANLIKLCLIKCFESDVDVVSLTFDGHSTNFKAIESLGCNINDRSEMKTTFKHPENDSDIVCFVDPSHVVKLVRNQLESKKMFQDIDDKNVAWHYLVSLNEMQNEEGIHLGNKLSKRHINFRNQIMKVKLATQLFSKSVATALKTCREDLKLPTFRDSEPTEAFIEKINDMFDIFNTRSMRQLDFKKPLCEFNKDIIFKFLDDFKEYILQLKVKIVTKRKVIRNGKPTFLITRFYKPVIESNCKIGFLGILINIESLKRLYYNLIETKKLIYIPCYKISQDHLEIMFTSIRMQGGFNDNPNVRQFKGSYRKLLSHLEIKCLTTGNCVPLENIAILNCTSKNTTGIINNTATSYRHDEKDDENEEEEQLNSLQFLREIKEDTLDLARRLYVAEFNDFKTLIIGYIAGSTAHYISKIIKCEMCLGSLLATDRYDFHKLIALKNKGGLCFPSQDVFDICTVCEVVIRKIMAENIILVNENQHKYIVTKILNTFVGSDKVFKNLDVKHDFAGNEHRVNLLKCIIEKYLNIRFHHISKLETISQTISSKRQLFKNMTQFGGFYSKTFIISIKYY